MADAGVAVRGAPAPTFESGPVDDPRVKRAPLGWAERIVNVSEATRAAPTGSPRLRRLLTGGALLLVVAVAVVAVANPVTGGSPSGDVSDDAIATSLATVTRRPLQSQTQVPATLGYAGSTTVVVPPGTPPSAVQEARQDVALAQVSLRAARATLAADQRTLELAQATLAADRLRVSRVCSGDSAATASASGSGSSSGSTPCQTAAQAVTSDEQSVTAAQGSVTTDQGQVASAQASLSAAEQSLSTAASSATVYDTGSTYTMLPDSGDVIRRGHPLYAVDGKPVLLLYGSTPAWRAFRAGMSPGRDVAELNRNLRLLGYASGLRGDDFSSATGHAISALQEAHGLEQTGEILLGSVVFEQGPVRVTSVVPIAGATVEAGPVLSVTSTRHQVVIDLDAARQTQLKAGDPATIILPDGSSTPGMVSTVSKVATLPSATGQDGLTTPTIRVDVKLANQRAAGHLDQAPVQVAITTARVRSALVVPVIALLASANGGYAVEVVDPSGGRRLVAVRAGLFDDATGLVQVSGRHLKAGQRVVVPGS